MIPATRRRAAIAAPAIALAVALAAGGHGAGTTAAAASDDRWLDEPTMPSAGAAEAPGGSPSPSDAPSPSPHQTPTPAPTGTTPSPAPAPTATPSPTPDATTTVTPTPTPTATPTRTPTTSPSPTAGEALVPTTGGGALTVSAPAQVGPQVQEGDVVQIPVLGITVSDTRDVGGFTATAVASPVLADGTSPVETPDLTWTTTAVRDVDGTLLPELAGPGGPLRPGAVIAQGDAGGRVLVVDGVITIDAGDLPPGDYAFSLSLSAT